MRAVARAVLLLASVVLSGCSGDAEEQTASPSASQSASSSASASAVSPTPRLPLGTVTYGPVTLVTGTDTFTLDEGRVTKEPDGSSHGRQGWFRSTLTSDDERVSGTAVSTWSTDRWGTEYDGAAVQWGRSRITNPGGRWVGRYTGVYTPETHDMLTWWFTGTGGYEGLSMYMWETTSGGFEATFHALVFPGEPPPS